MYLKVLDVPKEECFRSWQLTRAGSWQLTRAGSWQLTRAGSRQLTRAGLKKFKAWRVYHLSETSDMALGNVSDLGVAIKS